MQTVYNVLIKVWKLVKQGIDFLDVRGSVEPFRNIQTVVTNVLNSGSDTLLTMLVQKISPNVLQVLTSHEFALGDIYQTGRIRVIDDDDNPSECDYRFALGDFMQALVGSYNATDISALEDALNVTTLDPRNCFERSPLSRSCGDTCMRKYTGNYTAAVGLAGRASGERSTWWTWLAPGQRPPVF